MTQDSNLEVASMYRVLYGINLWFAEVERKGWGEAPVMKLTGQPPPPPRQENYVDNFWMGGIKKYSLVRFVLHT